MDTVAIIEQQTLPTDKKLNLFERYLTAVSYTHLTLPTNREV